MASQTTSSFVVDKEKVVIVRHKTLLLGSLDEENNLKPNYCTLKDNNLEKALMAGFEHLETLVKKEDLMVNLGALFMEQPDVFIPNGNVIGLLYQLNVLIVPTVAPIAVWAWQSQDTELFTSILGTRDAAADKA